MLPGVTSVGWLWQQPEPSLLQLAPLWFSCLAFSCPRQSLPEMMLISGRAWFGSMCHSELLTTVAGTPYLPFAADLDGCGERGALVSCLGALCA